MKSFPDESLMQLSPDSKEPIRGGSIGLNRILGLFVDSADKDRKPRFNALIVSAFTVFRNVWAMHQNPTMSVVEEDFVKDINLLLDYYDTYLSFTTNLIARLRKAPVVVYFPDYKKVEKELLREHTGKKLALFEAYKKFCSTHGSDEGPVRDLELSKCFWIRAGDTTYPHREVNRKFRSISSGVTSLYTSGDPVGLITHIPLDLHIASSIRNIQLIESYQGVIKNPSEFKLRLDDDGRVPFNTTTHVVFGDSILIKPMVTHKKRKDLLEQANKERWTSMSEDSVRSRICKALNISIGSLRKYNFE